MCGHNFNYIISKLYEDGAWMGGAPKINAAPERETGSRFKVIHSMVGQISSQSETTRP